MISTKDKMIFDNSFGRFNKDIVVVNKSNYNLAFNEIASIKIKKKKSFFYEITFMAIALILFILIFLDVNSNLITAVSIGLLAFTILYLLLLKKDRFYIQIILCMPKQLFISVNPNEYECAREFTKNFTNCRQLHTDL